jgi:hypothetical protein
MFLHCYLQSCVMVNSRWFRSYDVTIIIAIFTFYYLSWKANIYSTGRAMQAWHWCSCIIISADFADLSIYLFMVLQSFYWTLAAFSVS